MRLLSEHPLFAALPAGAAAAALMKASAASLLLAGTGGACAFLAIYVLGARLAEEKKRADLNSRQTALAKRVDALDGALMALQSRFQDLVLNSEVKADQRNQRLVREMKMIEDLVAQMARPPQRAPEPSAPKFAAAQAEAEAPPEPISRAISSLSEPELLEVIQSALEENRIDLYLQPIVNLPQRKVKHYQGVARLRSLDGEVIEPEQYEQLAAAQGLMPIVDNLLLFRCVQIVRRLAAKSARRGVFCRISAHSLGDRDFFPQFLEFMRENVALKDLLIFELAPGALDMAGTIGEANLEALAALGFHFAISAGAELKLDLPWLRRRNFRFVKLPAALFAAGPVDPEVQVLIDNFLTKLERQAIELIVEGIDTEADVLAVIEHDAALGEGQLFGGPRPIRRDLLEEAGEREENPTSRSAQTRAS